MSKKNGEVLAPVSNPTPAPTGTSAEQDLAAMPRKELIALCTAQGLKVSGGKPVLLKRLAKHLGLAAPKTPKAPKLREMKPRARLSKLAKELERVQRDAKRQIAQLQKEMAACIADLTA